MKSLFALALMFAADAAAADDSSPVLAMDIENGALQGAGADAILSRLPDAQFILVGEDHGFADSPEITAAIARAAKPYGVRHHVVEAGPHSLAWVSGILKAGEPDDLAAAMSGRPLALPFINMREDAALADEIVDAGGTLWAVDQEFIGSPQLLLDLLAARARSAAAKSEIEALLAKEKAAFAAFDQSAMFMSSADAAVFDNLRRLFPRDRDALAIVASMEESASIYQSFGAGANFASNTDRVALIRRLFLKAYGDAREKTPRAIFKMGLNHVGLGSTTLNTFDLGSFTEGFAAANGLDVLRIAFYPLEGAQTQIRPSPEGVFATVDYRSEDLAAFLAAVDVSAEDIPDDGYAVIALEPLRRKLEQKRINALPAEGRFILLGFDYLVTTRAARPATPLAN